MPRNIDDPRVVQVLFAFDRFMGSKARDNGFLDIFMNNVLLDTGGDSPLFDGWSDEAARAIVLAYAQNCPEERLSDLAETASSRVTWTDGWELKHAYERLIGKEGALDGVCPTALGSAIRDVGGAM